MDAWNQNLSKLLASYEASLQARHTGRAEEDQEVDEALTSTLLEVHDNTAAGLEKLDNEQIKLKDEVVKMQDEILAKLDAIDDKSRQSEELKNEAKALKDLHLRDSEGAKQELNRKRGLEDVDLRAALQTELAELIEARPTKKRRTAGFHDSTPLVSPNTNAVASCRSQ